MNLQFHTPHEITKNRTEIFVLSRNRADYLRECLTSVISSASEFADIIVSDNSTDDHVRHMMHKEFPNVRLIVRNPTLPALEHFNCLIEQASKEFFMLFHDDDIMNQKMLQTELSILDRNYDAAACACNSQILQNKQLTHQTLMGAFQHPLKITTPSSLLEYYMAFKSLGPASFPSYLYRTSKVRNLRMLAAEGGKFSDIAFLLKANRNGEIIWLPDCLMQTRLHASNDSKLEDIGQRLRFLRYVLANFSVNRHDAMIHSYRFRVWIRWWMQAPIQKISWRSIRCRASFVFILKYLPVLLLKTSFWMRVYKRIAALSTRKST